MRTLDRLALVLPLLTAAAAGAQPAIFADGFEGGDLAAWSDAVAGDAGPSCGDTLYATSFAGADGAPWPAPWTAAGGVDTAELQGGAARFRPFPTSYSLARLVAPLDAVDVEATFRVQFEDVVSQGAGFFVRSNGGYLQQTTPFGEGYAVFVEGFRGAPAIGVWKEENGVEIPLFVAWNALPLADDTWYRVRFRVEQEDAATTRLRARIWPDGTPEPFTWHVDHLDATPVLQNFAGGIVLDSWSSLGPDGPITAFVLADDVEVVELCDPLAGLPGVDAVAESFSFTEGPLWRGDHLLLTDLGTGTIHRLDPPSALSVFRAPSDGANGLALDPEGRLLAAEHATRRVSRTEAGGAVVTLVDTYFGDRFNSPNDLAVRSDGTVYFTDPDYGLADPADREIGWNGLFRRAPDGTVVAEWEGAIGVNQPNGVVLSPAEDRLYVADTERGEVLIFDVDGAGALSGMRVFASGLFLPDGMCVDRNGNLYVATWANAVAVFAADGVPWGTIPIPRAATNCAFGGAGLRDLYVTAHEGLYRVTTPVGGAP